MLITRKQRAHLFQKEHFNLSREVINQVPVSAAEIDERKSLRKQRKVIEFLNRLKLSFMKHKCHKTMSSAFQDSTI